ncbi:tetratricopeptide repeat protein [Thalassospira sp. GB04J01]|uniref:tetratricopeptide repeat protein n=1 Tax=Thalassospira sp. GB04J01 TaxID=1485225 RepID=UPI000C9AD7B9|nr:tetratricopeptide repeat protein [Thalassospira sp. GB04J01]|tara:strand:- start:14731 stop:17106 length:2376 start_codon:yes stop_codon:yes gene_type:complete
MGSEISLEFQNRTAELGFLKSVCKHAGQQARCCILLASPASGLTSFLQHAGESLAGEDCLTVYASSLRSGPALLFHNFFSSLEKQMKDISQKVERPEVLRKFVQDTVAGGLGFLVPGGGMLKPATDKLFERIRSSYHSSEGAARFSALVQDHLSEKKILFLIDNAQNLDFEEFDVFRESVGQNFSNVRFVLGFVDRPDRRINHDYLQERIQSTGQQVIVTDFQSPDAFLAEDLLEAADLPNSHCKIAEIQALCGQNAHKIIAEIHACARRKRGDTLEDYSADQIAVLRYLVAADQPLPSKFIETVTKNDPAIFLPESWSLVVAIKPLQNAGIIQRISRVSGSSIIRLNTDSHPILRDLSGDPVALLAAKNILYRTSTKFDTEQHEISEYLLALNFNLASKIDKKRAPRFALRLVECAIRSGSIETATRFEEALPNPEQTQELSTYLVSIAFLIATKKYHQALDALEVPFNKGWKSDVRVKVFSAICYDRCRDNASALHEVDSLLSQELEPEVLSVLGAVRMASLQHLSRIEDARVFYSSFNNRPDRSANYGYFLRNSAAVFPHDKAIEILEQAYQSFMVQGDEYGALTCRVNIGSMHANFGHIEKAMIEFDYGCRGLSRFGVAHMEEVICNLAFSEFYLGQKDKAASRLEELITYASENVPKLYALNHLALIRLTQGQIKEAETALDLADNLLKSNLVPIASLRHRLNSELLRNAMGQSKLNSKDLPQLIAGMDGPLQVIGTEQIAKMASVWDMPDALKVTQVYSPGFLEYWSFDALALLPGSFLPKVTVA